jgi:hypothetical protein
MGNNNKYEYKTMTEECITRERKMLDSKLVTINLRYAYSSMRY